MIILKELLDKFNIDYNDFPKGILSIKINEDLKHFNNFSKENGELIFTGEYSNIKDAMNFKDSVYLEVKIFLNNFPSNKKLNIIEELLNGKSLNYILKKYGLTESQTEQIVREILGTDVVSVIKQVKDDYTDYKVYDALGK